MSCTSFSVSRTDSPRSATLRANSSWRRPSSAAGRAMTHVEVAVAEHCLHRLRQVQQAQQIRGRSARAADGLGRLLVGHLEFVIGRLMAFASSSGFRFSRWMFSINDIASAPESGTSRMTTEFRQARYSCRAPAPLASDDLVALFAERARQNGLHYALGLERARQFFQRSLVHMRARLVFTRLKFFDLTVFRISPTVSSSLRNSASSPRPNPFILASLSRQARRPSATAVRLPAPYKPASLCTRCPGSPPVHQSLALRPSARCAE